MQYLIGIKLNNENAFYFWCSAIFDDKRSVSNKVLKRGCYTVSYDLTGIWKVQYFIDGDANKIEKSEENTWLDINNGDIAITFQEPNSKREGKFSGINVSNGYSGNYQLIENDEIFIGSITTTLVNELEWSRLFKISNTERFEVRNYELIMYRTNEQGKIVLERN